jgi:hypothetical protein
MSQWQRAPKMLSVLALAVLTGGCDEDKPAPARSAAPSAKPAPAATPEPKPSASAAAAEPAGPKHDCPEGSVGDGTFNKPCEAKGDARIVEVTWTGKMDDKGPSFRVVNKSKHDVLYGKLVVYFYDKAGKQLEAKDTSESPPKGRPSQPCAGNIFAGPLKAGEKAVITFSCVNKDNVPEGVAAIEGEMEMVGFSDETGKRNEYYWRNKDLTPDARPKSKAKK